jgi:hypothetical protein
MRWISLGLWLAARLATAETLGPGVTAPAYILADQHDAPGAVSATTRALLFSHDMGGGTVVKEAFATTDQAWLDARGITYVADISGMPALVTRLMALPNMRKRTYRMLLDREGAVTRDVPRQAKQVTLLTLEEGVVQAVEFFAAGDPLRTRLDALPVR